MRNKIKQIIISFIFCTVLLNVCDITFASEAIFSTTIYSEQTRNIENIFQHNLSSFDNIVYSIVPQGLIVSADRNLFFRNNQVELSNNGKIFLSEFAKIIKQIPNNFIVEVNSNDTICEKGIENWELTTIQAEKIEKYFIEELKVKPNQIRSIGFGEINPNLHTEESNLLNRVDFVILNYETIR